MPDVMKNSIIVVDDNDTIVDHKPRSYVDEHNLLYRVSALWLKNSQGEHLMARRSYEKKHDPGKWGPAVAGTVEEGQSYEDNIRIEIEEEIGLKGLKLQKGPKTRSEGKHRHFTQWFTAVVDKLAEDFVIQEEEVAEVKWFSTEELKKALPEHSEEFLPSIPKYVDLFS